VGRKDQLIYNLEMAYYAAGFQNAQVIAQESLKVLEHHFGATYDEIAAKFPAKPKPIVKEVELVAPREKGVRGRGN